MGVKRKPSKLLFFYVTEVISCADVRTLCAHAKKRISFCLDVSALNSVVLLATTVRCIRSKRKKTKHSATEIIESWRS